VGGFVSKYLMLQGAMGIGEIGIMVVLLSSSLLNAGYFAPITFRAFFEGGGRFQLKEAPWWMVIPLCVTALLSILVGIWPDSFLSLLRGLR
jgi:multicomponent Na+:H+ antiporter subunit D